jgi:hypothetical protein
MFYDTTYQDLAPTINEYEYRIETNLCKKYDELAETIKEVLRSNRERRGQGCDQSFYYLN